MEKSGHIEIRVAGRKGSMDLNPDNYDIRDIIDILQNAENLLFPGLKKERPTIGYSIEKGSVRHIIKTSLQAIIGFNAILAQVENESYSIDFLEFQSAKAFEFFQETAQKQNVEFQISTSVPNTSNLIINRETKFTRSEEVWVEAEFYFYGTIVDMGGKGKANVHLDTKEYGLLKIDASKDMLTDYENNPLYKPYGLRAVGKQNIRTGELDKSSLRLLEIIDYNPSFQEDYIQNLIKKAKKSWEGVTDADEWLKNVRGYGA
ncbi:MAG: hypothetical protein HY842_16090 [Bacteroidetes bacterium]|nr:hypothetical protein [Bacteroidota bacterium]